MWTLSDVSVISLCWKALSEASILGTATNSPTFSAPKKATSAAAWNKWVSYGGVHRDPYIPHRPFKITGEISYHMSQLGPASCNQPSNIFCTLTPPDLSSKPRIFPAKANAKNSPFKEWAERLLCLRETPKCNNSSTRMGQLSQYPVPLRNSENCWTALS